MGLGLVATHRVEKSQGNDRWTDVVGFGLFKEFKSLSEGRHQREAIVEKETPENGMLHMNAQSNFLLNLRWTVYDNPRA